MVAEGVRVDMGELAERIGVGRATLYRWFGAREVLLDGLLERFALAFLDQAREQAQGEGDDWVLDVSRRLMESRPSSSSPRGASSRASRSSRFDSCSAPGGAVHRTLSRALREALAEIHSEEELAALEPSIEPMVQVATALQWATFAIGDEPQIERAVELMGLMLAAARGGSPWARLTPTPEPEPWIDPELAAHSGLFERRIHRIGERVWCAVGYNLANIIAVEGPDGLVIVDTGLEMRQGEEVLADLREITHKRVAAIVYTHHHVDHVQGTRAFASEQEIDSGAVPVIAHESLLEHYIQEAGAIGPIMGARAISMYNVALDGADMEGMNLGIGPFLRAGENGFVPPTATFGDEHKVTLAGVRMEMYWVPSEAHSELCILLPDERTLLSAEVIQDHCFPNLYTLRGALFRDPQRWCRSIDAMRVYGAEVEHMVLQHGTPSLGQRGDPHCPSQLSRRDPVHPRPDHALGEQGLCEGRDRSHGPAPPAPRELRSVAASLLRLGRARRAADLLGGDRLVRRRPHRAGPHPARDLRRAHRADDGRP